MIQKIFLSKKQSKQVNKLMNELQSYLPFKECTYNVLMSEVLSCTKAITSMREQYCINTATNLLRHNIKTMVDKYYINGFKPNGQIIYTYDLIYHMRMINPEYGYTPLETVVAVKCSRALRDFSRSGFKNEDEFINRLVKISGILK